jgi:hypothetical protein
MDLTPTTCTAIPVETHPSDCTTQTRTGAFTALVDGITEQEWNGVLSLFADANIYQTWAYGAVHWGEGQLSHLILKCGGAVAGAAQLRIARLPVVNSGVAYLRWGPLWRPWHAPADPQIFRKMVAALIDEYSRRRGLLLRMVPNTFASESSAELISQECASCGFQPARNTPAYRTICVDLTASPEQMRKRLDQKWRNQLNSAERNGLKILEGTGDELFTRFLSIYHEMMGRKQFETTVNPGEFRRMQQRLSDDQKMIVLIAEKDGKLLSGLVGAAIGDTGLYLLGATSDAGMKSKGSYLLQWHMMQRLKERGCKSYDLGGINLERNPGVYHFKQGFGGQEVQQLNSVELDGSWLSGWCVGMAERARAATQMLKARFFARKPVTPSH